MKRILRLLLTVSLIALLTACGATKNNNNDSNQAGENNNDTELTQLVVGATNIPHAEILEEAAPLLKEKGIDLKIETFQEYVLPNKALEANDLDANFYQHIPYLEEQIAEHGYDFVNAGGIHIEPMGIYSQKYDSVDELPDGALVIMSSSVADHGRVLSILEKGGLITLDPDVEKASAKIENIVENPKNVKFETDFEPSLLPQIYNNNEGDIVAINSNFAIDAGLNPLEDAILLEEEDSPYVNIIAVNAGDENREEIKTLVDVLHSQEIEDFILEKYSGSVVPVSK